MTATLLNRVQVFRDQHIPAGVTQLMEQSGGEFYELVSCYFASGLHTPPRIIDRLRTVSKLSSGTQSRRRYLVDARSSLMGVGCIARQ